MKPKQAVIIQNSEAFFSNLFETQCDHCGETTSCIYAEDPFIREVYPEDKPRKSYWCQSCYNNRHSEV
jgi:hypothetical protein